MDKPQAPILLQSNEAKAVSVSGMTFQFLGTAENTAGSYAFLEMVVLPQIGPPTHRHAASECFYVLEGEFEFQVGDEKIRGGSGTFAGIPPGVVHGWRNVGTANGRLLCMNVPGGIEGFFLEAGHPVADRTAPPIAPNADDMKKQIELAPKYGIEVLPGKMGG